MHLTHYYSLYCRQHVIIIIKYIYIVQDWEEAANALLLA